MWSDPLVAVAIITSFGTVLGIIGSIISPIISLSISFRHERLKHKIDRMERISDQHRSDFLTAAAERMFERKDDSLTRLYKSFAELAPLISASTCAAMARFCELAKTPENPAAQTQFMEVINKLLSEPLVYELPKKSRIKQYIQRNNR